MKKLIMCLCYLGFSTGMLFSAPMTYSKVCVIPITGTVEPAMAVFIGRAIRAADPDALIVLEMDTFGGGVDAAFSIVDTMLAVPRERSVAYVKNKAISAGALIALSCGRLYMKENTTIGDCAPISISNEGPQMLGEKFQSPLRAKFRTLAKRNGFPEVLAESMVSSDRAVYQVSTGDSILYVDSIGLAEYSIEHKTTAFTKKNIVSKGELLTMDDVEAQALGFSQASVASFDALMDSLKIEKSNTVRLEQTWSESMVRFLSTISPILMMLGFALIYLEFKTPGGMLFGILGGTCLAIVFLSQYMIGLANYTEFLLIALGAALLLVEIFILPGTFIAGIIGVGFIAAGLLLSMQDFVLPSPEAPWQGRQLSANLLKVLGSAAVALILSFAFIKWFLPTIGKVIPGPYLAETLENFKAESFEMKNVSVGDTGRTITMLRPAGKAHIQDKQHDVVSEGGFIEKDTNIVVTQISANKIIVNVSDVV